MEKKKEGMKPFYPMNQANYYPVMTDPMGMYTGVVRPPFDDEPVQDADDL